MGEGRICTDKNGEAVNTYTLKRLVSITHISLRAQMRIMWMAVTLKQMEKLSVRKYSQSWIYTDVPPEA